MDVERANDIGSAIHQKQLSELLHGGREKLDLHLRLQAVVEDEPAFSRLPTLGLSHQSKFLHGLHQFQALLRLREKLRLNQEEFELLRDLADFDSPALVHDAVFVPCLKTQCSDEQLKKWLPPALSYNIIGAYCQTEIAHGSNVRGIMTTATYIKETDEFDLHTPCVEATKWWVGALGKTATHGVIFARLLIDGTDYGVMPFMCELRSMDDHSLLPGRVAGDVGPKLGFNGVGTDLLSTEASLVTLMPPDNGFLQLNHVRIPRTHMLERFARVTRDGKFERNSVSDKQVYGSMIEARSMYVRESWKAMARSATIAIRYSVIRRQFGPEGGPEVQVLDYGAQQRRLFPLLGFAYAANFTGARMRAEHTAFRAAAAKGDVSGLSRLHIITSCLKTAITVQVAQGIEICRICCGGHGYSKFSGLPEQYTTFVHMVTAEGDTVVLCQQVVRGLLKQLSTGKPSELLDVLKPCSHALLSKLGASAAWLLADLAKRLQAAEDGEVAWNTMQGRIVKLSMLFSNIVMGRYFVDALGTTEVAAPIKAALQDLLDVFLLDVAMTNTATLVQSGNWSGDNVSTAEGQLEEVCKRLRPVAVSLTDAFRFSDHFLASALGRADGIVYPILLEWATREPLNYPEYGEEIAKRVLPVLHSRL